MATPIHSGSACSAQGRHCPSLLQSQEIPLRLPVALHALEPWPPPSVKVKVPGREALCPGSPSDL